MKQNLLWGALLCLIASISWGAMFPVAHHAFQHVDPFYFTLLRYVPVAVMLAIFLWLKEGRRAFKAEGKGFTLWFFGTMGFAVYNLFLFWGQHELGSSGVLMASVMEALMPMVSIIIIWLVRGTKPSHMTLSFVILALIGVMLVITKGNWAALWSTNVLPVLALFSAIVGWVVYTIGGHRFSTWSALRYSALSCIYGVATATVIVFSLTAGGWLSVPEVSAISAVKWDIAFMVIFPGLIALLGWNVGVSILKPVNSLLFINFVPVTTVAISFAQGVALTAYDFIGVTIVIMALSANVLLQRRKDERAAEQSSKSAKSRQEKLRLHTNTHSHA